MWSRIQLTLLAQAALVAAAFSQRNWYGIAASGLAIVFLALAVFLARTDEYDRDVNKAVLKEFHQQWGWPGVKLLSEDPKRVEGALILKIAAGVLFLVDTFLLVRDIRAVVDC